MPRRRPIWYRSTAIGGAVFINELGETEAMQIEMFLFTFGKGPADEARASALEEAIEDYLREEIESKRGLSIVRIWTKATELFTPVDPSESTGDRPEDKLGAYRVGIRKDDKPVGKVDVRFRRSRYVDREGKIDFPGLFRLVTDKITEFLARRLFGGY